MSEHKLKKRRIRLAIYQGIGTGFTALGAAMCLWGIYASTNEHEFVHRLLLQLFATGYPDWMRGIVVLMTFGVYGCLMYIFIGVGHLFYYRLHGHKWEEAIEGAKWE